MMMMEKIIIWVLIAALSGSLMYYLWKAFSLLVSCDPSNISINVGLKKSDKSVQYVYSSGDIYSSFEIASTGYYTVYFQNDTSTEVEITGYYSTASAE